MFHDRPCMWCEGTREVARKLSNEPFHTLAERWLGMATPKAQHLPGLVHHQPCRSKRPPQQWPQVRETMNTQETVELAHEWHKLCGPHSSLFLLDHGRLHCDGVAAREKPVQLCPKRTIPHRIKSTKLVPYRAWPRSALRCWAHTFQGLESLESPSAPAAILGAMKHQGICTLLCQSRCAPGHTHRHITAQGSIGIALATQQEPETPDGAIVRRGGTAEAHESLRSLWRVIAFLASQHAPLDAILELDGVAKAAACEDQVRLTQELGRPCEQLSAFAGALCQSGQCVTHVEAANGLNASLPD
mmetsp:Transcript_54265/g.116538  ORF Transcript_54265/g.116538 Transcript_54265/m.116538 type:complete len:302 (-) Transcript_54265:1337-2242(-)